MFMQECQCVIQPCKKSFLKYTYPVRIFKKFLHVLDYSDEEERKNRISKHVFYFYFSTKICYIIKKMNHKNILFM